MPRFKAIIQYDGSGFFGWQSQVAKRTVQGDLETALARFNNGQRVAVTGAGRTDTGVHAWGQTAHFDLITDLDTCELTRALNANLDEDVVVKSLETVSQDFHARFSAVIRKYSYQLYLGENILYRNQSWMLDNVDTDELQKLAGLIIGEHYFQSFSKVNRELEHTRCFIYQSSWKKDKNMLTYSISGNRFLHHMVRYLTGTMVAVAQGRFDTRRFQELLNNPTPIVQIFKAPPQGLILEKVDYE